jgi:hypothetical protein
MEESVRDSAEGEAVNLFRSKIPREKPPEDVDFSGHGVWVKGVDDDAWIDDAQHDTYTVGDDENEKTCTKNTTSCKTRRMIEEIGDLTVKASFLCQSKRKFFIF